jgi:hypothetical protein
MAPQIHGYIVVVQESSSGMNSLVILEMNTQVISGCHPKVSFTNASFGMGRIPPDAICHGQLCVCVCVSLSLPLFPLSSIQFTSWFSTHTSLKKFYVPSATPTLIVASCLPLSLGIGKDFLPLPYSSPASYSLPARVLLLHVYLLAL